MAEAVRFPGGHVLLSVEAVVGGEILRSQMSIPEVAWNSDEEFRRVTQESLRQSLMLKILEKWKPVVRVDRQTW